MTSFWELVLDAIHDDFFVGFGAHFGGFLVTKTCSKQKWLKSAKHQFSLRKTIDFEVSGCHFGHQNRCQNGVRNGSRFWHVVLSILVGFWSHFGLKSTSFSALRQTIVAIGETSAKSDIWVGGGGGGATASGGAAAPR